MQERLLVGLAAVCGAIAIVQTLRLAWRRIASGIRLRHGLRGEREAEALLRSRGYRVRGRQVRALLEYAHAFGGSGVLLVDADRRRVAEIALPIERRPRSGREIVLLAIGAIAG